MPDHLALRVHSPRPTARPPGLVDWNGYVLPSGPGPFKRGDLLSIAAANGRPISPALLHKWRYWRLIPGPTAGGPTDKGRGKGQMWPTGSAWRVAWINRWLADTLTYDGIRLAIWPWTRELDAERIEMVRGSMLAFLVNDREFHDVVWGAMPTDASDAMDPYFALINGDTRQVAVGGSLDIAGVVSADPRRDDQAAFFERLTFEHLERTAATAGPDDLRAYIAAFRVGLAGREPVVTDIFWASPLALARIVVREFHRYQLTKLGEL